MTRWTLVAVMAAWVGAAAVAKPPIEPWVLGKERSPIEQALHTPERPTPSEAVPKLPVSRDPIRSAWLQLVLPRLGVVPLVPPVVW